ncbi:YjjW family glycine radical enzyme activase [Dielma fastidiosa]|uniref:YjjW family glycine radical enzyme activase n=1 Tax=Dielma fastidiosa TaxID=1034346 RepID=UPI001FD14D59|nr:YjjW family glycine radical enzyme activase [Dielma fastidiosa]
MKAAVNKIISFSNVDGPGNRCSIFFQSCPFRCLYCHNPETINMCVNCGECVKTCPVQALQMADGKVVWDKKLCVECDTCIKTCKHLASPRISWMSVEDVVEHIKSIKPFIRGITVSGGECMNHADFLLELFKETKKLGLTCLIDSNGYYDFEDYPELMAVCDGVMLDVKAISDDFHYFVTEQHNAMVLKNLRTLLAMHKLEEVRTVILPGYEDENTKTVTGVSEIIKSECRYKLLKYRYFGVRDAGVKVFGEGIVSHDELVRCQKICEEHGCSTSVII